MTDFTKQFNTELTPEETANFNSWANTQPRNIDNEKYDYDIQGWWKENPNQNLNDGHLIDKFKKPNHPTFSTISQYHGKNGLEGGVWNQLPDGSYTFAPGKTNFDNYKANELKDYFKKVEPNNKLLLQKYDLTPVDYDPFNFDHKANAAGINSHRDNGGRADLNAPISPGRAPSYGLRPPIMDPMLPDFETYQPNSIE